MTEIYVGGLVVILGCCIVAAGGVGIGVLGILVGSVVVLGSDR